MTVETPVSGPLPWQGADWQRLARQWEAGQLPHALLLTGPRDTGKARFALALARRLLCAQPESGLNCGRCHACELSARGSHGDFLWVAPAENSRVIRIDQVRQVVEFAARTAGFGLCKVVVFAPAEAMNTSAANALLKVLEEPPPNTYLILVSHRPYGLPATVRSRCQIQRMAIPTAEVSLEWLESRCGDRETGSKLLEVGGGRPLAAERLMRADGVEQLQLARAAVPGLVSGKSGVTELAAALAGDDPEQVLTQLGDSIEDLLRNLSAADLKGSRGRAGFTLLDHVRGMQRAVSRGANPNLRLLLDNLLEKVQRKLGGKSLGANIGGREGGTSP